MSNSRVKTIVPMAHHYSTGNGYSESIGELIETTASFGPSGNLILPKEGEATISCERPK